MKLLKCHCGAIEAEVNIPDNLEKILRCNCSLCKRKGTVMSMVKNEDFKIIKGANKLKTLPIPHKSCETLFLLNMWNLHTS